SIRAIPVLHPLPHIAMHIVQAPGIRLQLPYRMGLAIGILAVPGILPQLPGVVSKAIRRRRTGARSVLPLRFRWQAIQRMPFARIESANKRLYVLPGHHFHWPVRVARELAGIVVHHRFPLALRYGMYAQVKRLTDAYRMHGAFVITTISRAHAKLT